MVMEPPSLGSDRISVDFRHHIHNLYQSFMYHWRYYSFHSTA